MNDNIRKTPISTVELSDGIIIVRILADAIQTMALATENIKVCTELAGDMRRPLLLDLRKAQPLVPEIRQFYASREVGGRFSAIAIFTLNSSMRDIISHPLQRNMP